MRFHQVLDIRNMVLPAASKVMFDTIFSPGFVRIVIDCPPYEERQPLGLPVRRYPILEVYYQDSLHPDTWFSLAKCSVESSDPMTFEVTGNIRLHVYFEPYIEQGWTFRRIQVIVPVSEADAEAAANRNGGK